MFGVFRGSGVLGFWVTGLQVFGFWFGCLWFGALEPRFGTYGSGCRIWILQILVSVGGTESDRYKQREISTNNQGFRLEASLA